MTSHSKPPQRPDLILNGAELAQGHTGVSVYLRNLIGALNAPDCTLAWALALPEPLRALGGDLPAERLLIVPGRNLRGHLANEIAWQLRTARHVRTYYPEAVFHTAFHFWSPVRPRRMLATAHDCIEFREPSVRQPGRVRRIHRWLCWRTVRQAMRVLAVSNWTQEDLVKQVGVNAERIRVIYNWVDTSRFYRRSEIEIKKVRERYKLPAKYVAYIGGFRSYKNVELLLRAWANLPKDMRPTLALGGKLPDDHHGGFYCDVRSVIQQLPGLADGVSLPGAIADEDLPAFYSGAALFISPSRYEGFGYPPIEASACGAPALVADSSAYRELFPEHVRFSPDDVPALVTRILNALATPDEHRCGLDDRFTWRAGLAAYTTTVKEMLRC